MPGPGAPESNSDSVMVVITVTDVGEASGRVAGDAEATFVC